MNLALEIESPALALIMAAGDGPPQRLSRQWVRFRTTPRLEAMVNKRVSRVHNKLPGVSRTAARRWASM